MISIPDSKVETVTAKGCQPRRVAAQAEKKGNGDGQPAHTREDFSDPGSLLLVGVITYDAAEDRHCLAMTRAWEQRQSKSWIPDTGTPDHPDRRILELLATGAGSKQIARALSSNSDSAGRKIKKVLEKLGVGSRAEAVVLATRLKWICKETVRSR